MIETCKKRNLLALPGIEPGPTRPQRVILTIGPQHLFSVDSDRIAVYRSIQNDNITTTIIINTGLFGIDLKIKMNLLQDYISQLLIPTLFHSFE